MTRSETHHGKTIEAFIILLRRNKGAELIIQRDGVFFARHRYAQADDAQHALDTLNLEAIATN